MKNQSPVGIKSNSSKALTTWPEFTVGTNVGSQERGDNTISPPKVSEHESKRKPIPRAGRMKFLSSVLTILSKASAGTQFPDVDDSTNFRKRIKKRDKKTKKKTKDAGTSANRKKENTKVLSLEDDLLSLVLLNENKPETLNRSSEDFKGKTQINTVSTKLKEPIPVYSVYQQRSGIRKPESTFKVNVAPIESEADSEPSTQVEEEYIGEKKIYDFFLEMLKNTVSENPIQEEVLCNESATNIESSNLYLDMKECLARTLKKTKSVKKKPSKKLSNVTTCPTPINMVLRNRNCLAAKSNKKIERRTPNCFKPIPSYLRNNRQSQTNTSTKSQFNKPPIKKTTIPLNKANIRQRSLSVVKYSKGSETRNSSDLSLSEWKAPLINDDSLENIKGPLKSDKSLTKSKALKSETSISKCIDRVKSNNSLSKGKTPLESENSLQIWKTQLNSQSSLKAKPVKINPQSKWKNLNSDGSLKPKLVKREHLQRIWKTPVSSECAIKPKPVIKEKSKCSLKSKSVKREISQRKCKASPNSECSFRSRKSEATVQKSTLSFKRERQVGKWKPATSLKPRTPLNSEIAIRKCYNKAPTNYTSKFTPHNCSVSSLSRKSIIPRKFNTNKRSPISLNPPQKRKVTPLPKVQARLKKSPNNNRDKLYNLLKKELSNDKPKYNKEPRNFYQSLKMMGKNRTLGERTIRFSETVTKTRPIKRNSGLYKKSTDNKQKIFTKPRTTAVYSLYKIRIKKKRNKKIVPLSDTESDSHLSDFEGYDYKKRSFNNYDDLYRYSNFSLLDSSTSKDDTKFTPKWYIDPSFQPENT